jgi:hypothetical protein
VWRQLVARGYELKREERLKRHRTPTAYPRHRLPIPAMRQLAALSLTLSLQLVGLLQLSAVALCKKRNVDARAAKLMQQDLREYVSKHLLTERRRAGISKEGVCRQGARCRQVSIEGPLAGKCLGQVCRITHMCLAIGIICVTRV